LAQYLLTYLQRIGDNYLRWAVCDDKYRTIKNHGHGSFEDAAQVAEKRKVVMVIAGTEVLLQEAVIPATNLARALKAVPYSLEEQLAQDVEASHFAFGTRLPNGNIPVAVIARDRLEWVRSRCVSAKLNAQEIIPETMALPFTEGRWTIMTNAGHAAVRMSSSRGFSCDADMLPLLLTNFAESETDDDVDPGTDANPDEQVWQSMHFSCGDDQYELGTSEPPIYMRTEVELFARGLAQRGTKQKSPASINLLQGNFSKSKAAGKVWKPWRVPAALAATLCMVWGGSAYLQYQALGKEEQRLRSEQASSLKRAFPDVRRPENDPVRQMRSRLKLLSNTGVDNSSFVVMMSALGTALKDIEKPLVKSLNFRSGKLDIELEAESVPDVDKLKSRLEVEKKIKASVLSANKDRDRIKARMRLETEV